MASTERYSLQEKKCLSLKRMAFTKNNMASSERNGFHKKKWFPLTGKVPLK